MEKLKLLDALVETLVAFLDTSLPIVALYPLEGIVLIGIIATLALMLFAAAKLVNAFKGGTK